MHHEEGKRSPILNLPFLAELDAYITRSFRLVCLFEVVEIHFAHTERKYYTEREKYFPVRLQTGS